MGYYYAPKPPQKPQSTSASNSASSSTSPPPSSCNKELTIPEQTLCAKIAQFTVMHESHIIDCYKQLKETSFDAFAISEIKVWTYVFEERQRMFCCMISMLNFVITNECPNSQIANSITNHIRNWIENGWKSKILSCYDKLTEDAIPDHLPIHLRPKYCEFIAEEQLLLWKMVFLLFSEPLIAELEDIDFYFKLYDMSLRRVIQKYFNKTALPNAHNSMFRIHQTLKKIDDLLIAVFMLMLPMDSEHGLVDYFEGLINK